MFIQILLTIIAFIALFTYTKMYQQLKIKLMNRLNDEIIKYASKKVPSLMMGNMNTMFASMMNEVSQPKMERVCVVKDGKIYIPFTLKGCDYTIGMKFNSLASLDTKIHGVTADKNISWINHHPGTPFMLKAEDLGFQSIRVCNEKFDIYEEYLTGENVNMC